VWKEVSQFLPHNVAALDLPGSFIARSWSERLVSTLFLLALTFFCTVFLYISGGVTVMLQTTYTNARANFAGLCDEVTENREIVVIRRRKGSNVAMIAADELQSLVESAHLMRSPKNAERLLSALERALKGVGDASSLKSLRSEVGLED
jgi:antitoxin YefM